MWPHMIQWSAPLRERLRAIDFLAVGLVAFLVRIIIVAAASESSVFSDMVDYHARALLLLEGKSLPDSFRGPGFPAWLALHYALPGDNLLAARVGNAALGAATAVLTGILALEFVGRKAATAAAFVVALYPASALFSVYILTEGLYSFLTLATLVTARRVGHARTVASGMLIGLSAMTRSLGIALIPTLWAGYLLGRKARGWTWVIGQCAVLALACAVTLGPWLRHTARVSGGVMLDSASALNVLLGNNPRARERLQLADFGWVWETYLGGTVDEADRNRRALGRSWQWIRENPVRALQLSATKIVYLWGLEGREHAWAYSNGYFGAREVRTVQAWGALLMAAFPLLALPAVIGMLRPGLLETLSGVHIAVMLALTTALHAISFSETRFHLPLVPMLAVLAARGVATTAPMTRARWSAALLIGLVLCLGWWAQFPELLESYARLTVPDGWRTMRAY